MSNTHLITRKISVYPIIENNNYTTDDIYTYLRKSITAQNNAFNILTSAIYFAKKAEKSNDEIENIYFSYSHQSPDYSLESEKTLYEVLSIAPVTEEKIDKIINDLKEYMISKNKKEKSITSACDKKRKAYSKYIGQTPEQIKSHIDRLKNYCAYPITVFENFANGFSTPAYVTQQVKGYWKAYAKTVLCGTESVRNMTSDNPLIIPPNLFYNNKDNLIGITHEYESDEDFYNNIYVDRNLKVNLVLPYKKNCGDMVFRLVLGNPNKSHELRCMLYNIFTGIYRVKGSKLGFEKNKKTGKMTDLVLMLTMEIPTKNTELDENTVVGVDLGQAIPAVCALNNDKYARTYIGSANIFKDKRTQIKNQRSRINRQLSFSKGGHGRSKKLNALDRFESYEKNFASTFNHMVSKRIVDFAIKNKAKYINLEYLKGYDANKKILSTWSYYQLQQDIKYKAEQYGIVVRFINPAYTSQVCSFCGHYEQDQRKTQEKFSCGIGSCDMYYHKRKNDKPVTYVNADFNAARNIAKSTLFIDYETEERDSKKLIEEAKTYYGIE